MAIDSRDSKFLRSPSIVPTNTDILINNLEGKIDDNVLNVFKAVVRDITEYKKSMYGITRRFDNMLFLYNSPTGKDTDIIEAARMNKTGQMAIGTEYPIWSQALVDVNGVLYAIPQWVRYQSTANGVGNVPVTWDTQVYINNQNLYLRTTANTRIQFLVPGHYYYNAIVDMDVAGVLAGQQAFLQSRMNGATVLRRSRTLNVGVAVYTAMTFQVSGMVQTILPTDYLEITVGGAAAVTYLGTAAQPLTTLEIVKVN